MKQKTYLIIIFLILLWIVLPQTKVFATTYYLDANNGNDSNPGTSDAPWKTLNRAYTWYTGNGTKVTEGDTVLFRNGSYGTFRESTEDGAPETYYINRSNWITYKAELGYSPRLNKIYITNYDRWGILPNGNSYFIFDGFTVQDGIDVEHTSYIQIKNCNVTKTPELYTGNFAPYYWPGINGIAGLGVHYLTIENNEISNSYRGIYVGTASLTGSSNIIIKNNNLHHFGEDGMVIVADNVLVENNTVYDINSGRVPINFEGIRTGTFTSGDIVEMNCNDGKPNATGISLYRIHMEHFKFGRLLQSTFGVRLINQMPQVKEAILLGGQMELLQI